MTPSFFILGAARSGSTSLFTYLGQHPDVLLSTPKETRFFDWAYERGIEYYWRTFFSEWNGESAVGEATPHYLYLPFVGKRIREYVPDARLIAILRHPVHRSYSHWWMERVHGREPLPFAAAIRESMRDVADGSWFRGASAAQDWDRFMTAYEDEQRLITRAGYIGQSCYAPQISCYMEMFAPEQMKIVLLEDLSDDPESVVRDLWGFLSVDRDVAWDPPGRENRAKSRLSKAVHDLAAATGLAGRAPRFLRRAAWSLLGRVGSRPPLDPDVKRELIGYFRPLNRQLELLLDRDLSHWNE